MKKIIRFENEFHSGKLLSEGRTARSRGDVRVRAVSKDGYEHLLEVLILLKMWGLWGFPEHPSLVKT